MLVYYYRFNTKNLNKNKKGNRMFSFNRSQESQKITDESDWKLHSVQAESTDPSQVSRVSTEAGEVAIKPNFEGTPPVGSVTEESHSRGLAISPNFKDLPHAAIIQRVQGQNPVQTELTPTQELPAQPAQTEDQHVA